MMNIFKRLELSGLIRILCLSSLVFLSSPSYATYYGGHHYKHYYGHNTYSYHRPYYNYHHRHHDRYRAHYGVHARFNETAAYVVLGVLGVALLAHVFTNDEPSNTATYPRTYPTKTTVNVITPSQVKHQKSANKKVYYYRENEGWERLVDGNANYALDIFAVQSQQNLNSGEPKVGFALAAASMGEKQRAVHAMRKAIRIDANALNTIDIDTIKPIVKKLRQEYQTSKGDGSFDNDTAFIMAAFSYLEEDYKAANTFVAGNDLSQSANNLRTLLKSKL